MKIISSFTDYYDSAMAFLTDHDDEFVFERKHPADYVLTNELHDEIITCFDAPVRKLYGWIMRNQQIDANELLVYIPDSFKSRNANNKPVSIVLHPFSVLFCGKVYHGIDTSVSTANNPGIFDQVDHQFFYDAESLIGFLESYPGVDLDKVPKGRLYRKGDAPRKQFELYFSRTGRESSNLDFVIEQKLTIAVYHPGCNSQLSINDNLSDVQFYRVFDAYTAYQELEMWLGGVLAYPPNFMVEISDKSKIQKGGFDPVYGFRKRPAKTS